MNNCRSCGRETKGIYCNNKCQQDYQYRLKVESFKTNDFVGRLIQYPEGNWKRKLIIEEYGEGCACCGITEWMGKPITLEVNHIDGKAKNNTLSNLELLCPNCHSQTPTFRNKNKKSDRINRL